MTKQAVIVLQADRVVPGPITYFGGVLQQETRLFQGDECACVLLLTFPTGSPEWEKWHAARTLDAQAQRDACVGAGMQA